MRLNKKTSALEVALVLTMLPAAVAQASPSWEVVAQGDGITVWTHPATDMMSLRGQGDVAAPLMKVAAVLWDVARRPEWMPNCIEAGMLETRPPAVAIFYSVTRGPPLIANRDVVQQFTVTPRPQGALRLTFQSITDPRHPPRDGTVRVPHMDGHYDLVPVDAQHTQLTYEAHIDVGGDVPKWVTARAGRDAPLGLIKNLRREVDRGDHRKAQEDLQRRLATMPVAEVD